jgi:coenzyme F420 hydrogenase subunit delta
MIEEMLDKPILVFGCGNTLFGDDGFGPAVIEQLRSTHNLPENVFAEDVGTSIGDLLFDMVLSPSKPKHIFILDAVSHPGKMSGELFELELGQLPRQKAGDFCLHQFPSVNLLMELRDHGGVEVRLLAVQIKAIPEQVGPGLSPEVAKAVPEACDWLIREIAAVAGRED